MTGLKQVIGDKLPSRKVIDHHHAYVVTFQPSIDQHSGKMTGDRFLQCAVLKPRAAQLLVLRHSGLSYAEIAQALNVARSSVGTLLARAEKEFERRYRALEADDGTH